MYRLIDCCKNSIKLSKKTVDKIWVYGIYNSQEELVFMFYGKLREIMSLSPFRINPKFDENEEYTVVLVQPCKDKIDAENALTAAINNFELKGSTPAYNVYNRCYNNTYYIQCLNNGKFYRTAQDVVKIFRVSQPALSNHLRGVTGYRHVKGLTFKIYNNTSMDAPKEVEMAGGYKWVATEGGGYKTVQSDDILNREGITEAEVAAGINTIITMSYLQPLPRDPIAARIEADYEKYCKEVNNDYHK